MKAQRKKPTTMTKKELRKKELRKEFVATIKARYPEQNIDSWDDIDFAFNWFYSKIEEIKITERQEWERLQLSKIDELEAKLKEYETRLTS